MSNITFSSIETTVGDVFHAAISRVQQFGAALAKGAGMLDKAVNVVAPIATTVLGIVAPQDVAAVAVAKTALNALDAAIEAAGESASTGVSLSLPEQLVADWKAAKAALVQFESTL